MATYHVGERFSRNVTFGPDYIQTFATMAGDHNPLHHDLCSPAAPGSAA
jgi:acyl dehydratase